MTAEVLLFWVFGTATVLGALFVISARSPMSAAMALVATFFFLAGVYVLLWAHAIAVLQVLVYAGAIMVLFLFVIMLLSLAEAEISAPGLKISRIIGGASTLGLLAVLGLAISRGFVEAMHGTVAAANRTDRPGAAFTVRLPIPASVIKLEPAA